MPTNQRSDGSYSSHKEAVNAVADIIERRYDISRYLAIEGADSDVAAAEDEGTYQSEYAYIACSNSTTYYVTELQ